MSYNQKAKPKQQNQAGTHSKGPPNDLNYKKRLIPLVYLIQAIPQLNDFMHNEDLLTSNKHILNQTQSILDNYLKCLSRYYNREPPYNNRTIYTLLELNSNIDDAKLKESSFTDVIKRFFKEFHDYYREIYLSNNTVMSEYRCLCHELFQVNDLYRARIAEEIDIPIYQLNNFNEKIKQRRCKIRERTEMKMQKELEPKCLLLLLSKDSYDIFSLIKGDSANIFSPSELFDIKEDQNDKQIGYNFIGAVYTNSLEQTIAYCIQEDHWVKYDDSSLEPKIVESQFIFDKSIRQDNLQCLVLFNENRYNIEEVREIPQTGKGTVIKSKCVSNNITQTKKHLIAINNSINEVNRKDCKSPRDKKVNVKRSKVEIKKANTDSIHRHNKEANKLLNNIPRSQTIKNSQLFSGKNNLNNRISDKIIATQLMPIEERRTEMKNKQNQYNPKSTGNPNLKGSYKGGSTQKQRIDLTSSLIISTKKSSDKSVSTQNITCDINLSQSLNMTHLLNSHLSINKKEKKREPLKGMKNKNQPFK